MGFFDALSPTIGIDPGSDFIRIAKNGKIIFNEPSRISFDPISSKVSGIGNKTVDDRNNKVIKPVNFVIKDFQSFEMLLRGAIKKSDNTKAWVPKSYKMYFSLPIEVTEVEKRAYRDAAEHAGAKEVFLIYQSVACALGLGILTEKKHFILIDFSASKIEMAIFANSIPIATSKTHFGTWKIKKVIRNYISRSYGIIPTEEELELLLRSYQNFKTREAIQIQKTDINTEGVIDLLERYFKIVDDEILEAMEQISNHAKMNQIISNGIYFTGGGSLINGMPVRISQTLRMSHTISSEPLLCNIKGVAEVMSNPKHYGFTS